MANRLKHETSPYLLQHAENPVDWYPWGEAALQRANDEHKPIFLSIGYAACHWCHVMAHESFEDPDTAAIMNEHFINIKVDREERPDIDNIYMDAVVAMTGQGGWPMSVFMTPEGRPFYGGTYFPPERRYQMPSFREVLTRIAQLWTQDRESLLESADKITGHIRGRSILPATEAEINQDLLDQATERMFRAYDWRDGGWGGAPKFPQATSIEFLLMRHVFQDDPLALDMSTHALAEMAAGGIYDHLGGGFHRYSVDDHWLVPHFEKMLYDTALLTRAYLHAWRITGETGFKRVVEDSLDFLIREMRHHEGGFFSSLDADSEGEEGKYYVWSESEIREILADDETTELFLTAYGVTESGNFEGANILHRAADDQELAERFDLPNDHLRDQIATAREDLLEARNHRIRPGLDDKVLTSWNGLLLISLSEAARMLDRPDYLDAAQDLAKFLVEECVHDGELRRSWRKGRTRYSAYLEDHAAMGLGLLALYECDLNPRWYQAAQDRVDEIIAHFRDGDGGFYDTRDNHEVLIARPKSLQDTPIPSSNTLATWLLMRMFSYSGDDRLSKYAEGSVGGMAENAARQPTAFSGWLISMQLMLNETLQLAILGDPGARDFQSLHGAVKSRYIPNLIVAGGRPKGEDHPGLLQDRRTRDGKATAYLCRSFTCKTPTTSLEQLQEQLEGYR